MASAGIAALRGRETPERMRFIKINTDLLHSLAQTADTE